jgi:hypothetical protein
MLYAEVDGIQTLKSIFDKHYMLKLMEIKFHSNTFEAKLDHFQNLFEIDFQIFSKIQPKSHLINIQILINLQSIENN